MFLPCGRSSSSSSIEVPSLRWGGFLSSTATTTALLTLSVAAIIIGAIALKTMMLPFIPPSVAFWLFTSGVIGLLTSSALYSSLFAIHKQYPGVEASNVRVDNEML